MMPRAHSAFRGTPLSARTSLFAIFLFFCSTAFAAGQQAARPIVTDQTSVALSDKAFGHTPRAITPAGDVFFGNGDTFLRWTASSGTRTRLLQVNDPIPDYPGSVATSVAMPMWVGPNGHVALVNNWAAKGVKDPAGVFVYDGSQYHKVALTGESVPGVPGGVFTGFKDVRVNASDQVAFVATFEPAGENMLGVFLGTTSGPPVKIAIISDLDALFYGPDNIYLIGVDAAGDVAFLCEKVGSPWDYAVVVATPSGTLSVIRSNTLAPGTAGNFNLPSSRSSYGFNANGDLAFFSSVYNDPAIYGGIWIRSAAGTVQKLVAVTDPTGTSLGGTYNTLTYRGFNDSGQVLYSANLTGTTSTQALFRKTLATAADLICYRNQTYSGSQQIDTVNNAVLGPSGKAVVLANLKNPSGGALMLRDAATSETIALVGSTTPLGGTFNSISGFSSNGSDQVVFSSAVPSLGANAVFVWTSGSPIQAILNTNETILPGAQRALYDFRPIASDDEVVFWEFSGEGKDTIFTRSLRPGDTTIRRVIGDGDAAPTGGTISYINNPAINDKEELVVASSVLGGPSPAVLWLSKPGNSVQKVVALFDAAPGSAGGTFSNFPTQARINNQSQVAFFAGIQGASGNSNAGIFLVSSSGTVQKIVRVGDASPLGGTFVNIYNVIQLSDIGTVAFRATSQVSPTQQVDGYFVGTPTALTKVMAVGDTWGEGTFSGIKFSFKMNRIGQVAFWAGLSYASGGIFIATPGSTPAAIAIADGDTPVVGGVIELTFPDAVFEMNDAGQVAFWGVYSAGGTSFGTAYYVGSAGSAPVPVVSMGQALPGGGTCPLFAPVPNGLALSQSGELAMYVPGIAGAADLPRYLIASPNGTLRRFAAVGTKALGTGSEFGRLGSVGASSSGKFFIGATLVEGPDKQGLFESGAQVASNDIDQDGVTDIIIYRPESGVWFSLPSSASGTSQSTGWGAATDVPVPGDYDGDGKTDIAVWRPTGGFWYVLPSGAPETPLSVQWGLATDVPVPGDYDGDGKADLAVYRPSDGWWYVLTSSSDYDYGSYVAVQWGGMDGDIPVPADYDGDGRMDIAIYRPSTGGWYILTSSSGYSYASYAAYGWGDQASGDVPVPGDYDGDGRADIAVWRASTGTWYILRSSDSYNSGSYLAYQWGVQAAGDVPVPGDYDGDGRTDLAIWRAGSGTWYILKSSDSYDYASYLSIAWGGSTDLPLSSATAILRLLGR